MADSGWVGGPDEGFGIGVGLGHEAVDGELQVDDGFPGAVTTMPALIKRA